MREEAVLEDVDLAADAEAAALGEEVEAEDIEAEDVAEAEMIEVIVLVGVLEEAEADSEEVLEEDTKKVF
jgi:hypothetical protein